MTTLNTALNYNFASAESARIANAERGAEDAVAAQLRTAAAAKNFIVGSTVTARFQYKVGEDGSLVPLQTQVTTEVRDETANEQGRKNQRNLLRQQPDERQPSFKDITRPRPELSPTDELEVFADQVAAQPNLQASPRPLTTDRIADRREVAEAFDDNGDAVDAESIAPQLGPTVVRDGIALSLSQVKAQFSVANLYARNNDIVYNVTPITQIAA